ncbi:MAG: hypothetical protein ABI878_12975 [Acidobacteriota bacterium]
MDDVYKQRPTDQAKYFFGLSANKAITGVLSKKGLSGEDLADVLHKMAAGMEETATGLRATYMLLAEVNSKLK